MLFQASISSYDRFPLASSSWLPFSDSSHTDLTLCFWVWLLMVPPTAGIQTHSVSSLRMGLFSPPCFWLEGTYLKTECLAVSPLLPYFALGRRFSNANSGLNLACISSNHSEVRSHLCSICRCQIIPGLAQARASNVKRVASVLPRWRFA